MIKSLDSGAVPFSSLTTWRPTAFQPPERVFPSSLKLPAGMSGSPIFDDERVYVHGVVSKGWVDKNGPANFGFGSMLAYSLGVPINPLNNKTLVDLQKSDDHGFPKLSGPGL